MFFFFNTDLEGGSVAAAAPAKAKVVEKVVKDPEAEKKVRVRPDNTDISQEFHFDCQICFCHCIL